jgi:hypothetical protein
MERELRRDLFGRFVTQQNQRRPVILTQLSAKGFGSLTGIYRITDDRIVGESRTADIAKSAGRVIKK